MNISILAARRRQWFTLRWPSEVAPDDLLAALFTLNGSSTPRRSQSLVLFTAGRGGSVTHHLGVPKPRADGVRAQLEAAVAGLAAEPVDDNPALQVDRCWRCWISSRERPLVTDRAEPISRGVLTALASTGDDETLTFRWILGPVHRPIATGRHRDPSFRSVPGGRLIELATVPSDRYQSIASPRRYHSSRHRPGLAELATVPTDRYRATVPVGSDDAEARRALANKKGVAGWHAALHLGVIASGRRRQRQLLGRLAAAVRVAQNAGVQPGFRTAPMARHWPRQLPRRRPLLINVPELHGLAGWPIGPTEHLGVDRVRSRLLPPDPAATTNGRVVADATYPTARGPLTLSAADALHHAHIIGPTGVGKTTLLLNLICQDIAAGRSIVLIEPRGDLVADVLDRIPAHREKDVVVIDPTDSAPVGVNPLATRGVLPEVKVDHLLTVFKRLWRDSWGPRTEDNLASGLLTLTTTPHLTLVALPRLFQDPEFRHQVLANVHDPFALEPFWHSFEQRSRAEQDHILAPLMNKLRAFLLRSRLRRIVGQPAPRFDLRDVHRRPTILLTNLAVEAIGPESGALLGSLLVSQLWQALQGRAAVAPPQRRPVMVYVDEFQTYTHLPTDFADVLATARGLGISLTLAHQHLAQLPADLKDAVRANARSKVVFATVHEDAAVLVRSDRRLQPADVTDLGKYDLYASLMADGETTPFASGRTLPPPPALGAAELVRRRSRERWGIPAGVIDAEFEALFSGGAAARRLSAANRVDAGHHSVFGERDRDTSGEAGP